MVMGLGFKSNPNMHRARKVAHLSADRSRAMWVAKSGFSRRILRDANQFMFCGTAMPRSDRQRERKTRTGYGRRLRGWSRSTDFLIVVPGPSWRNVFLQKWASGKKGPTTRRKTKIQTYQLRNEAQLNSVSLRSQFDHEVAWRAVKGHDERALTGNALDSSPRHRELTACRPKIRRAATSAP